MTQRKSYIVSLISTAVFAVLSFSIMFLFKANEAYFDAHGRLGNLAQTEQNNMILETSKAVSYKRNINVSIDDKQEKRLVLPLASTINEAEIMVREEFASNKLVVTLQNGSDAIENDSTIVTDSSIMSAVGIYKQDENAVLEIYEDTPMGYEIELEQDELVINFKPLRDLYEYVAVIYIPFEKKDRLYSEEWISSLNTAVGEGGKVYLASAMRENYSEDQVLDFVNKIGADLVIAVDYNTTDLPEYMEVIYNGDYFIPDFASTDLAVMERSIFEDKTGLNVAAYIDSTEDDLLIKHSKSPAAKTKIYIQTQNETIEEKYTLNHNVMEGITSIIKDIRQVEKE